MKLKNQVSTLEQSKILKDKYGLELNTYFVWRKNFIRDKDYHDEWVLDTLSDAVFDLDKGLIDIYYPAPSCAELGVLLPKEIKIRNSRYIKTIDYDYDTWSARYVYYSEYSDEFEGKYQFDSDHESHAKADLLIHLFKEGIVEPKDLTLED